MISPLDAELCTPDGPMATGKSWLVLSINGAGPTARSDTSPTLTKNVSALELGQRFWKLAGCRYFRRGTCGVWEGAGSVSECPRNERERSTKSPPHVQTSSGSPPSLPPLPRCTDRECIRIICLLSPTSLNLPRIDVSPLVELTKCLKHLLARFKPKGGPGTSTSDEQRHEREEISGSRSPQSERDENQYFPII